MKATISAFPGDGGNVGYSYNLFNGCEYDDCASEWFDGDMGPGSNAHHNLYDLDPQFVDFVESDYRLSGGSPAIDAGDPKARGPFFPDGDGDGIGRIDIGPYEYLPNLSPVAEADGPCEGEEGAPVTFDGSSSSDPESNLLEYRWDFDGEGEFDTDYSFEPFAESSWKDDFTGVVILKVKDENGLRDTDTAPVEIRNVAPTVSAVGGTIDEGEMAIVNASFADPGMLETHKALIDWGDSTPPEPVTVTQRAGSGSLTASHVYDDNGANTVTVNISDDDGGVGEAIAHVEVANVAP